MTAAPTKTPAPPQHRFKTARGLLAASMLSLCAALPAAAQTDRPIGAPEVPGMQGPDVQEPAVQEPTVPPPMQTGPMQTGPAQTGPAQTGPAQTESDRLFTAINRNDLDGVKQALRAGADLDARNAFGVRPLDLAVDLGRYDIVFYLLSFRNNSSETPPTMPPAAAPPPTVRGPDIPPGFDPAPDRSVFSDPLTGRSP